MAVETLHVLRHGETDSNKSKIIIGNADDGLNEKGFAQAATVAEHLTGVPISIIYTSPQRRAVETAKMISDRVNVSVVIRPELSEREYGPYDGMSREQLVTLRKQRCLCIDDPTQDWHGVNEVESDESVWERVRSLLEIAESHHTILMVTHAGVIKSLLHSVFEIPHHRHNCFKVRNGTLIILKNVKGRFELHGLLPATTISQAKGETR